jgi:hypothetical protein
MLTDEERINRLIYAYSNSDFEFQGSDKETGRWICDQEIRILKNIKNKKLKHKIEKYEENFQDKIKIREELLRYKKDKREFLILHSNKIKIIYNSFTMYRNENLKGLIQRVKELISFFDNPRYYHLCKEEHNKYVMQIISCTLNYIDGNIDYKYFNESMYSFEILIDNLLKLNTKKSWFVCSFGDS